MIKLGAHVVVPTIFPDKTSQVWHVQPEALAEVEKTGEADVTWEFQHEGEFMHLAQLCMLLKRIYRPTVGRLYMPYLPYARQDKHVSNESTFALHAFAALINRFNFSEVRVLDAHSSVWANKIKNLVDKSPRRFIQVAIEESGADLLLFPDASAEKRYAAYDFKDKFPNGVSLCWVTAEKIRLPSTGEITGFKLGEVQDSGSPHVKGATIKGAGVLIVDDLCDGGRTFIEAAKAAYERGAKSVSLYVTHGIFSRGLAPLREAGIKRIWTYKGEVKGE